MDLAETKALLEGATRQQLVDRAFGDAEVYWYRDGAMIANGYFGRSSEVFVLSVSQTFTGKDADALRYCGTLTQSQRNDSQG